MKLVTHPDNAEVGAIIAKERGVELQTCNYLPVESTDEHGVTGPVFYLFDERPMEFRVEPFSGPMPEDRPFSLSRWSFPTIY
jgi:hypothetical protein